MAPMVPRGDWMDCIATKAQTKVYINRWPSLLAASFDITVLVCSRMQEHGP